MIAMQRAPCCSRGPQLRIQQLSMTEPSTVLVVLDQATPRRCEVSAHCLVLAAINPSLPPAPRPTSAHDNSQPPQLAAAIVAQVAAAGQRMANLAIQIDAVNPLTAFFPLLAREPAPEAWSNSKRGSYGAHGWLPCRISVSLTNRQAVMAPSHRNGSVSLSFCQPNTKCATSFWTLSATRHEFQSRS
jgi:hypothetical protein